MPLGTEYCTCGCVETAKQRDLWDASRPLNPAALVLSTQERSLLRLLYHRGASQREVAGALGISRAALRRRVRRARDKAADPVLVGLALVWRRLSPAERRLAYLHHVLDVSLAEITRRGLGDPAAIGNGSAGPSRTTLRRRLRGIERKAKLAAGERRNRETRNAQGPSSAG